MSIPTSLLTCVTFVIGRRDHPATGDEVPAPVGTAFFVGVVEPSGQHSTYAVTARHVVRCEPETRLRVNLKGGGWRDVEAGPWVCHERADVAAARFPYDSALEVSALPIKWFADAIQSKPSLGDPVYFIGLLNASALVDRNVPVVRSGTVAALYEPAFPVQDCDGVNVKIPAHLIDCRSYGGFSGSPCFAYYKVRTDESLNPGAAGMTIAGVRQTPELRCLGLISGHWDSPGQGKVSRTDEDVTVPMNSGVGIVTPIEQLRELLVGSHASPS